MSLEMLRREGMQGIARVVATPDFYARYEDPQRFLQRREQAEQKLRAAMAEQSDMPELLMGAEVYYFRGIAESEILPKLAIRGTNSILVELPSGRWEDGICRDLTDIWEKRGLTPIVAHIDRYIRPLQTHGIPKLLQQLPVLVQANTEFFLDRTTASMAMKLLKADQIQLLGSDCHNLTDRKPNLAEAIQRIETKLGRGPIEKLLSYETLALSARQQETE